MSSKPLASPSIPSNSSSTNSLFEFQRDLLSKEIEYIHAQISHFDNLTFQIKGWAITIWSAIIAFGSTQNKEVVVLASLPAMVTFWILDAMFKKYQRRLTVRMAMIEMFLDSKGPFKEYGLQTAFEKQDFGKFPIHDPIMSRSRRLYKEFNQRYESSTSFLRALLIPNVAWFYLFLILSSIIVASFLS